VHKIVGNILRAKMLAQIRLKLRHAGFTMHKISPATFVHIFKCLKSKAIDRSNQVKICREMPYWLTHSILMLFYNSSRKPLHNSVGCSRRIIIFLLFSINFNGNIMHHEGRRKFLGICLGGITAALGIAALWPVWRYLAPDGGPGKEEKKEVARDRVPIGRAYFFTFRGHPSVVLQPKAGQFIALTAVCTHLGCIVKWLPDKGEFLCPCHAGRYSPTGKVLGGPPPAPLESYPVSVREDKIVIG
jgi:cytochrome b6-f complex iron-sulfur subunit